MEREITVPVETPTSQIYICKGVPFGNDYRSTILFESYTAQMQYFAGKAKYQNTAMKPFTLGEPILVPYPAEQLYECNYLYFTSQTSARHWCAFITGIQRVNSSVASISYQLDVLQNWQFEWHIPACMVLREHVSDDTPGSNIQPEPLDTGDYVFNKHIKTDLFAEMCVMVMTLDSDFFKNTAECVGGIFQGIDMTFFDVESNGTVPAINDFLGNKYQNPDSILSITMFPKKFKNATSAKLTTPLLVDLDGVQYTDIDGYKARNYKLYTYPYNMMYVTTLDGDAGIWRYEWFDSSHKPQAQCACACSPNAQASIAPFDYAGYDNAVNWEEKVTMQPFPVCGWASDTYRAYLAQNSANISTSLTTGALSTVSGIAATSVSAATGNIIGVVGGVSAIASGAGNVGNTLQQEKNHAVQPLQAKGNIAGDTIFSMGSTVKDFHIFQRCIQKNYAQAIDSFFDIYGYAVNKVKVPNLKSRPSWNYVQTENMQISGEIALDDINILNSIFNRGVTFWHGDYVGDYSRANK